MNERDEELCNFHLAAPFFGSVLWRSKESNDLFLGQARNRQIFFGLAKNDVKYLHETCCTKS
jgi:hypothetical protein